FRLGADEEDPWSGMLYRQRFACDASTNQPLPVDIDDSAPGGDAFHVTLLQQARNNQRDITTVVPSPAATTRGVITSTAYAVSPTRSSALTTYNVLAPDGTHFSTSAPSADGSINSVQGQVAASLTASSFSTSLTATMFGDAD